MNRSRFGRPLPFCILFPLALIFSGFVTSCGKGPPSYTIGGTISGLSGKGLVLQNNGGDSLSVSASGSFTFTTAISNGGSYSVTVLTQPTSPTQNCTVANGTGTPSASVTSVQVACVTITYTIGGMVTNLDGTGAGLELQDNGGDTLMVNADGAFTFATALEPGTAYDVTVSKQPSAPAQTCVVMSASGIATANVTNITVDCGQNEWTWVSGSNIANQAGTYGTEGTAALGNIPGGRNSAVSWTDANGNFWLFGGAGYDPTAMYELLNDLWKYSGGEWTWVSGSNVPNQKGTYGTQGVPAPGNVPGARSNAVSWNDASGNFWLFGGSGYDSTGTTGDLNDLWKYSAGEWTWMGGSNVASQKGTYGIQGAPAPGDVPGARRGAAASTDSSGNFWLSGGNGYDSIGTLGYLNDLWKYSGGEWTWVSGANVANQVGTYGTQGTAAPGNVPGARQNAAVWTDTSGNFWLFGGSSAGGYLDEVWKYSAGQWVWVSGSNAFGSDGRNPLPPFTVDFFPGGRAGVASWADAPGNFWIFGGGGLDEAGGGAGGLLNELWKYSPALGAAGWTAVGGGLPNEQGIYGTQGTPGPSNLPGGRQGAVVWKDASGNFWLFGGYGFDSTASGGGFLNDLWRYEP